MSILTVTNLSKNHKKQHIVNNINLHISSGEIVGLFGPNGSGKSTTFRILSGILQQDSGNILFDNKNIDILPIYLRARLGINYLPQESSIFRQLTVFNNLMAVLQNQHNLNKKQRNIRIMQLLETFHIKHLKNHMGHTLSGGERKRVEIARAIAANPKFILLDEPFSGIDPISVINIQKIIKILKHQKLGILITDHNVKETIRICNRAYILYQGKCIAQGSPIEILNNKHVQEIYLGNPLQ